jgi:hypothetical protein
MVLGWTETTKVKSRAGGYGTSDHLDGTRQFAAAVANSQHIRHKHEYGDETPAECVVKAKPGFEHASEHLLPR